MYVRRSGLMASERQLSRAVKLGLAGAGNGVGMDELSRIAFLTSHDSPPPPSQLVLAVAVKDWSFRWFSVTSAP